MNNSYIPPQESFIIRSNYLFITALMAFIVFILSSAFFLQFYIPELPCPLCMLQRVAFLGIGFGLMMQVRNGFKLRYAAISLVFNTYLQIISVRQILLDIVKRPGHHWIGGEILGIHLPTWSFVLSIIIFLLFSVQFAFFYPNMYVTLAKLDVFPKIKRLANFFAALIVLLCLGNLISVIIQCSWHICHTFHYQLLT